MTISLVTGLPGTGKTLYLTEKGVQANAAGRPVYANFKMTNLPNPHLYHHFNDPLEVLGKVQGNNKGPALVLISEVGIVLNQIKMWEIPTATWDELSQHRKDGVNILADCQAWKQPCYMFKELVQFHYNIYGRYKIGPLVVKLVRVRNPISGEHYGRRYWIQNPRYYKHYDTKYKLEVTPSLYDIGQSTILAPWEQYERESYQQLIVNINKNM
ncbi:hypothetical protein [Paenibacillus sp. y28]|uniref:hypothetical protein n=1 Tax=Paenibacillus sp. y28 TaxID=3129110 RepID=UPI003019AA0F